MTTPATTSDTVVETPARSRLRRLNPATRYLIVVVGLAIVAIALLLTMHAMNTEPRDSTAIADRELRLNVIAPDEHVVSSISVFKREAVDYFRATRGELVLTDRRMVFLGLRPRDLLSPADAPATFDERDFPLDTLVSVTSGRAIGGLTKGIVVRTPTETMRLGVTSTAWPAAEKLLASMDSRRATAQAQGVTQESMRKRADAEWKNVVAAWKKQQIYTVRRGDALGSIATAWNSTPERLQQLNHLPDHNIRMGQTLVVRPAM
jgi:hypothetical protein